MQAAATLRPVPTDPGERNGCHIAAFKNGLPDHGAAAHDKIEDTVRQAAAGDNIAQCPCGARYEISRFDHHRVAVAQRRRNFPRRNGDGKIPWRDEGRQHRPLSRVTSTSRPGRVDATFSPHWRSASPAKNRKICPGTGGFANALRQCLAFFA